MYFRAIAMACGHFTILRTQREYLKIFFFFFLVFFCPLFLRLLVGKRFLFLQLCLLHWLLSFDLLGGHPTLRCPVSYNFDYSGTCQSTDMVIPFNFQFSRPFRYVFYLASPTNLLIGFGPVEFFRIFSLTFSFLRSLIVSVFLMYLMPFLMHKSYYNWFPVALYIVEFAALILICLFSYYLYIPLIC